MVFCCLSLLPGLGVLVLRNTETFCSIQFISAYILSTFEDQASFVSNPLSQHSVVKNSPDNPGDTGDVGSIPGLGRSPEEGNDNPFQYPCLGNPMDRDALGRVGSATGLDSTKQATVHGLQKSQT